MPISANSLATDAGNAADRPLVRVRGLKKSFGAVTVLDGIDLDVKRGDVVSVIGPSGSGKTTLLRCINALETYSRARCGSTAWRSDSATRPGEAGPRRRRSERELASCALRPAWCSSSFTFFRI